MPPGWNAGRMGKSLASMSGPSDGTKRSSIPCITSPFWPANPAPFAVSLVVAIGSRPKANAPFKEWDLPLPICRVWGKLERQPGGDRQMVDILSAMLTDGIEAPSRQHALHTPAGQWSKPPVPRLCPTTSIPPVSC